MELISVGNLISWATQLFILISAGAILPRILRIDHPRSYLVYCYLLLAACLILPLIEPLHHPVHSATAVIDSTPQLPAAVVTSGSSFELPVFTARRLLLCIIAVGVASRLLWLLIGLIRLLLYRKSARLVSEPTEASRSARSLINQDADIYISNEGIGPVTFGALRPAVLLPRSFLELDSESQHAVLCHELLHVKRGDWAITLFEQCLGALLWFHPAFWWLLSQTKLALEQLVDAEVARLTGSRDVYIACLLAMSAKRERYAAAASLFLQRKHLSRRVHLLVQGARMSTSRLLVSYSLTGIAIIVACTAALIFFPITGRAQIQEAKPVDGEGVTVDPGATILHRPALFYPWDAAQQQVDGTVTAELVLNDKGEVIDARILGGPDEFRRTVLESVLQWHYSSDRTRRVQARIDFLHPSTATPAPTLQTNGVLEAIDISELPSALQNSIWERVRQFKGMPFTTDLVRQIEDAVNGSDSHLRLKWSATPEGNHILRMFVQAGNAASSATAPETMHTTVTERLRSQASSTTPEVQTEVATSLRFTDSNPATSAQVSQLPVLISKVNPQYPAEARRIRYQGTVVLEALIRTDGTAHFTRVVRSLDGDFGDMCRRGIALGKMSSYNSAADCPETLGLDDNAIAAIEQWRFAPATKDGVAVPIRLNIEVNFNLK